MAKKHVLAQSAAVTLSSVRKEMAKPRVVESARKNGDTVANGGHIAVAPSDGAAIRAETERTLLDYAKKVGS